MSDKPQDEELVKEVLSKMDTNALKILSRFCFEHLDDEGKNVVDEEIKKREE